jgi:hypothetical protein
VGISGGYIMTRTATSSGTFALTGISHDFGTPLRVDITLDELNTIYCHANVDVAEYPDSIDEDVRAALVDGTLRATLTLGVEVLTPAPDSQSRAFDLVVVERKRNDDGSYTFELASDEGLLEIRGLVDDVVLDRVASIGHVVVSAREVIDSVLDDYLGAALESGTVDADVTRTLSLTNIIRNPGFENNIADWVASSNASGLVRSTTRHKRGAGSLRWTATAAGNSSVRTTSMPYEAGRYYYAQAWGSAQVARDMRLILQVLDEDDNIIYTEYGSSVNVSTSTFDLLGLVALLDITSSTGKPGVRVEAIGQALAAAAGNQFYIDQIDLIPYPPEAAEFHNIYSLPLNYDAGNYFDGDGSPTDSSSYYTYSWDGPAGNSPSKRTRNDDRGIQLLYQQPGQTYRAFLDPIVDLVGGRLFCDEARDWRLVDDTYTVAGTLDLTDEMNVQRASDTVSLSESFDGIPTSFTGVVVIYETVSRGSGSVIRQYDVAGDDSGRIYTKTVTGAYPGAGAAAAILARAAGRERNFAITAALDLDATPGKALTFERSGTDFEGVISRVNWLWTSTSEEMTITPRDLTEA